MKNKSCPYSLLAKLGSLVVHCEELFSSDGHEFDKAAIESIVHDPEVIGFALHLRGLALLPVKRKKHKGNQGEKE